MTFLPKTECVNGHSLLDPANVYTPRDGRKRCRACRTMRARESARHRRGNAPADKALAKWRAEREQEKRELIQEAVENLTDDQRRRLFFREMGIEVPRSGGRRGTNQR